MRIFIFFFILSTASSAQTFNSYYSDTLGAANPIYSVLASMPDGSLIATDGANIASSIFIYRFDPAGNIIWKNLVSFGGFQIVVPYNLLALDDSTVIIKIDMAIGSDVVLLKCKPDGTLAWSKKYSGLSGSFVTMMPDMNNGLVLVDNLNLVYINSNGTVKKALHMSGNHSLWEGVYKGNGTHAIMGLRSPDYQKVLFDIDSSGIISNNYYYTHAAESTTVGVLAPYKNVALSASGGVYILGKLIDNPNPNFSVICVNSQNQPVWSRKIESISQRHIVATSDGGCIVNALAEPSPVNTPMLIKFDNTGTVNWIKAPLEILNPSAPFSIQSIISDGGSGWYSVSTLYNMHISHADSTFDSFCNFQNVLPVITPLQIADSVIPISLSPAIVTQVNFPVTITPSAWYRYDACTGILIDSVTITGEVFTAGINIYPNPVSDLLNIELPEENQGIITIYNVIGENVSELNFNNQKNIQIDVSSLNSGIYVVNVLTDNWRLSDRIMKRD